jgi:hypothetical protein
MTGAEKVLKWYNECIKTNKIAPTEREIKWQIEMAIDEENSILKAQTPKFKAECEEAAYCILIDEHTNNVLFTGLKPKKIYKDGDCIKIMV